MKIKYVLVCCVLFSLVSPLICKIPKVKIDNNFRMSLDGVILESDVGGVANLKKLANFTEQIKKLRNTNDINVALSVLDDIDPYLDLFKDKNVKINVHNVGKYLSFHQISNILFAIADLKKVSNFKVGVIKSYVSAAIFSEIMKNLIEKTGTFKTLNQCLADRDRLGCELYAKDGRNKLIKDVAEKSGNFLLMYILSAFFGRGGGLAVFKEHMAIVARKARDINEKLVENNSLSLKELQDFVSKEFPINRTGYSPSDFTNTVKNFAKRANLKLK